jgi:hypothetical protein
MVWRYAEGVRTRLWPTPRAAVAQPTGRRYAGAVILQCGILAHGFLRLGCDTCKHEMLPAFSCKKRGFVFRVPAGPWHRRQRIWCTGHPLGGDASVGGIDTDSGFPRKAGPFIALMTYRHGRLPFAGPG